MHKLKSHKGSTILLLKNEQKMKKSDIPKIQKPVFRGQNKTYLESLVNCGT